ncbi:hypothetical protein LLG90_18195 [Aromatoleum toluclasticum]|uniref:hypothetical protein n=1 Tax=Aromatoleum toluclasticum TaxID=92003 RepID=UPI001D1815C9|nr:hypothetical protein [Aromatoleum toluclasticum]MCC4117289.1 hypothetical protein [Aromatoleum toluclasticum]
MLLGYLASGGAVAADEPGAPQPTGSESGSSILDRSRVVVHDFTEGVARRVDSWFGDKPFEQGGKVSGQIGFKFLARQHENPDASFRFGARLDMPNVKERSYLFFGQENERELVTDQPEPFTRRELLLPEDRRQDQTLFAGVGYALRDNIDFRAGLRSGIKPYAQARYKKDLVLGERNRFDFRETIFWNRKDGVGSTTGLNFGHAFTRSVAFRWQLAGTISDETDGLAWSNSMGIFKTFGDQRSLSLEALIGGMTAGSDNVSETGVRAIWKQPVYRDWTLVEVSLGHFWPQGDAKDDSERGWALGVGFQILF